MIEMVCLHGTYYGGTMQVRSLSDAGLASRLCEGSDWHYIYKLAHSIVE